MLVVACIQKKIINYLSWWLITGSEWLDNYIMSFNRVPAHGFIMGKSPDFPYLCVYKSICQRLAFACKSYIHRRFIYGCKGLHIVFYTLEQKKS